MKVSRDDIVNFLRSHQGWQSAKTIAEQFGVTTRTIRNHIAAINSKDDSVIESSQLGYRLNVLSQLPESKNEDSSIITDIFYSLYNSKKKRVSIASLINNLYISEASILEGISKFNKLFTDYKVKIKQELGSLYLSGSEYNKRRVFHKFVGNSLKNNSRLSFINSSVLIPNVSVNEIQEIISSVVNKRDLIVNGYEMNDLLIHYAISINRIISGNTIKSFSNNTTLETRTEYKLTTEITEKIESKYNITFGEYEKKALTLALVGKTITKNIGTKQLSDLENYIPKNIIEACLVTISKVEHEYNLNLSNPSFIVRFIIHVKNMIDRSKVGTQQDTESLKYLINRYPLLNEMALFVIANLNKILKINIDNSEAPYLLLHLGSYLEDDGISKINTLLLSPKYYDISDSLQTKINEKFGDDLHITEIFTNNIYDVDSDSNLIITTVPIKSIKNPVVQISPFLTSIDVSKIRKVIDKIKTEERVQKISQYLRKYMDQSLFFINTEFENKREALEFAYELLHKKGYVESDFLNQLNERENLAATSFDGVAVPHTLKMNSIKTGIVIFINKKPILWSEDDQCRLIITLAVSQEEVHIFGDLLQSLIEVLSIKNNINRLLQVSSHSEFLIQLEEDLRKGAD